MYDSFSPFSCEDPDEMQHKVAFYQDLHCHLQGLKNIILYIFSDFILPILQPNTGCFPIQKRHSCIFSILDFFFPA